MHLIFFDLDGTLEDSREDMIGTVNSVRETFQLPDMKADKIGPHVTGLMDNLYRGCFPELFPGGLRHAGLSDAAVLEKIRFAYEADYSRNIAHETALYPGMEEALKHLAETATLALYTEKPEALARKLLLELNVSRCFSFIIGSDTFGQGKPSPEPMAQVAADIEFSPETDKSFMIGDSPLDMEAARAFQAVAVWCAWGYHATPPENPQPDHIVKSPAELLGILKQYGLTAHDSNN